MVKGTTVAKAGLLCLLAGAASANYVFEMKDLGCDYTIHSVVSSSATSNTTEVVTEVHGTFRRVSTKTTSPEGVEYITETVVRPDLASTAAYALHVVYTSTTGCCSSEQPIQATGGSTTYKNRVETIFNGHKCYKYYDVESNAIYADSDGYVWGSEQTNDNGEVSIITYTSYDTSAVPAGDFALSSSMAEQCSSKVTTTPDNSAYSSACSGTASGVYVVEPPNFGCDVKVLLETIDNNDHKTQTTVYAHGTFLMQYTIDTETWQTVTTVLTRPDQGEEKGYAVTYTLEHETSKCEEADTLLAKLLDDTYYFENREEEYYNGFSCYKYYNDSSLVYYVDASQGYPRGLVQEGKSTTQFLYYDTTPLNKTTFVFADAELEACGNNTGADINDTIYADACGAIVLADFSDDSNSTHSSPAAMPCLSTVAAVLAVLGALLLNQH